MAAHCIFGHPTLKPYLIHLIAGRINADACCVVINAGEDQINALAFQTSLHNLRLEAIEVFDRAYVLVVSLDHHFFIDALQALLRSFDFAKSTLAWEVEHPVHIGKFNFVVIVKDELAYATSGEHFSDDRPHASYTHN